MASPNVTTVGDTSTRKRALSQDSDTVNSSPTCDLCRSRKVKCDRAQPQCSNCRRAGVACKSSTAFKRVNQTKQLQVFLSSFLPMDPLERADEGRDSSSWVMLSWCVGKANAATSIWGPPLMHLSLPRRDDFSVVLERISDVDQTLRTLTELARQISARSCNQDIDHVSNGYNNEDFIVPSAHDRRVEDDTKLDEFVELEHGGKRIFGPSAGWTLIQSLFGHVGDIAAIAEGTQGLVAQAVLQRHLDNFPFRGRCPDLVIKSDGLPITTPPQLLIDLYIETYLRHINTLIPVFDETSLRHAVNAQYVNGVDAKSGPWALIFNNIVLLGLSLQIQVTQSYQSGSWSMNGDMIPSLLRNCDRALASLDDFTRPSSINIQALLTLVRFAPFSMLILGTQDL
jgi:hypothetical protein